MKVVKYRRSGWEGGTLSLQRQEQSLDVFAEHNGWEVVGSHSDLGSTSRTERPGLDAAIAVVERGDAEAIIATSFDRIARAPYLVRVLFDKGVRVITPDLDTASETGRFALTVLDTMVQAERQERSERTRAGIAAAKARRESRR